MFMAVFLTLSANSQKSTTVTGNVKTVKSDEMLAAVSVTIKGGTAGTFTDDKGNFSFSTNQKPPFILVFSSVGYASKEVRFTGESVKVELMTAETLGQEVTVAASKVSERILESPISIERINLAAIRNAPSPNYYEALTNLKGVDVVNASLTFRSVGTRGFNSSGNLRLNQIVDGMDNQAPGLNFSVASICGLTELDAESLELLPGASSALYGPGGMNGTVIINAKDPFKYQGLSFQVKGGVNHIDSKQRDKAGSFHDWSIRWAKKVNDKFAYKLSAQLTNALDWAGNDETNFYRTPTATDPNGKVISGSRTSDPNYDGVNTYGDETSVNLQSTIQSLSATYPFLTQFGSKPFNVSRTGFLEKDVINPTTLNVKLSGAFHYKITNKITASVTGYIGKGNTVYTGADRYSLKDLQIAQYKFELKHKNWFLRAYTTKEDAGSSFNATISTRLFNEAWKPSSEWYSEYTQAFVGGAGAVFGQVLGSGGTAAQANAAVGANASKLHNAARAFADKGRPTGFIGDNELFKQVTSKSIKDGGGLFVDQSNLYMIEGQANLSEVTGIAKYKTDVLVGGNFKRYVLNSKGTLFAEDLLGGKIPIDEVGGYVQISQKLLNDKIKITASGRYDKNSNFDGKFTPRVAIVGQVAKDHNVRVSYQTAYRFPSTQNQYINLLVNGGIRLMGGLPFLRQNYGLNDNQAYTLSSVQEAGAILQTQGPAGFPAALAKLKKQTFDDFKPESLTSIEIGYKGLVTKNLLVDAYFYLGTYKNFIGDTRCIQTAKKIASPLDYAQLFSSSANDRTIYSISTNLNQDVKTSGWGLSAEYQLPKNFNVSANIYSDVIDDLPSTFVSYFNTPKTRANFGFGNSGFLCHNRVGFNIMVRTQASMVYQGTFGSSTLPGYTTVDAMVSYKIPVIKSLVKLGATNLYNKYYRTGFGSPAVGGLYYVSFGYNIF
jgi:outer membrane receptor protein involved in Fe transport